MAAWCSRPDCQSSNSNYGRAACRLVRQERSIVGKTCAFPHNRFTRDHAFRHAHGLVNVASTRFTTLEAWFTTPEAWLRRVWRHK